MSTNGIIYKLRPKNWAHVDHPNDFYIGSSEKYFTRQYHHKYAYNKHVKLGGGFYVYEYIKNHGGFDAWEFEVLDIVNCGEKKELLQIEAKYIEELGAQLNKNKPGALLAGKKEYHKKYYINNRDKIMARSKKYYNDNKNLHITA
jgi:hypothetical protein